MSANITLAAGTVDTTGKVWTFPLLTGGVTGSGYAITDASHLTPRNTSGWTYAIASVSVVGTNLVVNTTVPAKSTETLRFDLTSAATITDGSGNTPTGQSNVSVTNGSTATVTDYTKSIGNLASLAYNGIPSLDSTRLRNAGNVFPDNDAIVSFTSDATGLAFLDAFGTASVSVDGGSYTDYTYNFENGIGPTGLSAGSHLFRIKLPSQCAGIRLIGSTTVSSVQQTIAPLAATGNDTVPNSGAGWTAVAVTSQSSSPVRKYGAHYPHPSNAGRYLALHGVTLEFQFTGTGFDVFTVVSSAASVAVTLNGAQDVLYTSTSLGGSNGWASVVSGLAYGTYTVRAIFVGVYSYLSAVRIIGGTRLASPASSGATSVTVESGTGLAVGQWVQIGPEASTREFVKITSVSGTTIGITALATSRAAGVVFNSLSAPAATIAAATVMPTLTKRLAFAGNSNTEGANTFGFNSVPDSDGRTFLPYDNRESFANRMCDAQAWEAVNAGFAGFTSIDLVTNKTRPGLFSRGAFDSVVYFIGTNDLNPNNKAAYKANITTMLATDIPQLNAGCKVILLSPQTPTGTTGASGATIADYDAALAEIAADVTYSANVLHATKAFNGLNLTTYDAGTNPTGDLDGVLHYMRTGHVRIANNLAPYAMAATGSPSYATSGTSGTVTVTRGGGTTFSNAHGTADQITLTASAGTITATAAGGTITNNGTGTVTVKPADGAASFTYTASTTATITYTNGQGWTNPAATSYTAVTGKLLMKRRRCLA